MKQTEKIKLIDGDFKVREAKELLVDLYNSKINFHKIKNISTMERFGKEDELSNKRIVELKKSINQLLDILKTIEDKDAIINIKSIVEIKIDNG